MKKKNVLLLTIIILTISIIVLLVLTKESKNENKPERIKEEIIIGNMIFEYDSDILIKDILLDETPGKLDTELLGEHEKIIETDEKNYHLLYKIVDTMSPIIKGSSTITKTKGSKDNLINEFMCGDNHDDKPNCYIEGAYDLNKIGTYNLTYKAEDTSGNTSSKDFKLNVINKTNSNSSTSSTVTRVNLSEYISKYKNENSLIGIDVSAWQGNIDYKKAKNDGVEFVIIRIGYGPSSGEYKLDKWFDNNIKEAKKYNLPIGVYFYSYADSQIEAKNEAKWIIKKLNGTTLDLGIAFDWENWSSFNKYNVSFKKLNDIAHAFINEVEANGYEGMIYSSAYYLNHIWKRDSFNKTWLAYYTNNNDYSGKYNIWQLSSKGKVNGISGSVDVNILYK